MEMKVGKHIQSSYSKYKNNADPSAVNAASAKAKSMNSSMNVDTFSLSPSSPPEMGRNIAMEVWRQTAHLRKGIADGTLIRYETLPRLADDDYLGLAERAFDLLNDHHSSLNEYIAKRFEEEGIPKDISFEFDYDIDKRKIEITDISDEEYRESVQSILDRSLISLSMKWVGNASRILNGYMSSVYYSQIADALERCFGQDISELYIDEDGNIGGANEKLLEALEAEKNTADFDADLMFRFPVNQIEGIIKRLITDENITPNISHMSYNGNGICTNDGDIKLGREIDPDLWKDDKFLRRLDYSYPMIFGRRYDFWLNNENLFY
ncbi:MAG: hypothetical protein J1E40_08355 [Oscillospiraceae bacterium]|nr:hypothetical protein [Oscillospiraceae bacterium]